MSPKNASYYGNRAATLMMLCRYREALEDCQQAVRLDNSFMKASRGKRNFLSRGKSPCGVLQCDQGFCNDVIKQITAAFGTFDNSVLKSDGTQELELRSVVCWM